MNDYAAGCVVVTGATSGIGLEVARIAAARGSRVVLIARRADALADVAAGLAPHPAGPHLGLAGDVADESAVEEAISRAVAEAGVPWGLVNCAGIVRPALLADTSATIWRQTMETNLTGTFLMTRAVATRLQQAGLTGSIVNVGSEASFLGMPRYAAYCASKAALLGLTRSLAAELAPRIRVNLLCPGPVDTPMLHAELAELAGPGDVQRLWESEAARVPLGRIATARETAEAAVWLLTDAVYATGSVLSLDGGTTGAFMGAQR